MIMTVIIDDTQNDAVVSTTGEQLATQAKKRGPQPAAPKPAKLSYKAGDIEDLIDALKEPGWSNLIDIDPLYQLHKTKMKEEGLKEFWDTILPKEWKEAATPETIRDRFGESWTLRDKLDGCISLRTRMLDQVFRLKVVINSTNPNATINAVDMPAKFKRERVVLAFMIMQFVNNPTPEKLEEIKKQNTHLTEILRAVYWHLKRPKPAF